MKKSSKAQFIAKRKCDVLFSQIVRSIGHCEFCGKSSGIQLQCAHIISRRFGNTRTDPQNALCLCASCHRKSHDNPLLFARQVLELSKDINLNELHDKAYTYGKMDWVTRLEELKVIGRLVESGKLTLKELRVKSKWETFELSASDLL